MVIKRTQTQKYHHSTTKKSLYCCEVTLHGLNHWYKHEFEQLGWMILAKNRGMTEKIINYKYSLQSLKKAIEHKLTHIHEKDRKDDLNIMLHNIKILCEHVDKDFP
jgi:hypothetical protein